MNQKLKSNFGFTLAELLMVVVILGILSAVALPRFAPQKEKAYVAEAIGIVSAIRQSQEAFRLENGVYCSGIGDAYVPGTVPTCTWDQLGLGDPTPTVAGVNYAWAYAVGANKVRAVRQNNRGATSTTDGKSVILTYSTGAYSGDHPNKPNL